MVSRTLRWSDASGRHQAAGALRYPVDRDYHHATVAAFLSPHGTEFTFASDEAPAGLHLGRARRRGDFWRELLESEKQQKRAS